MGKKIHKAWGYELVLSSTNLYTLKKLVVNPGWRCSLHRHKIKDETFVCESGYGWVCIENDPIEMRRGLSVRVMPQDWHYFWCPNSEIYPMVLLEVSTRHSDDDVERQNESSLLRSLMCERDE